MCSQELNSQPFIPQMNALPQSHSKESSTTESHCGRHSSTESLQADTPPYSHSTETFHHRAITGRHSTTESLLMNALPQSNSGLMLYHEATLRGHSTTEPLWADTLQWSHSVRMLYHGNGMCEVLVLVGVGWSTLPLRIATTLPKMCGPVLISSCSILFKKDNANTHNISSIFIFICLILIIP